MIGWWLWGWFVGGGCYPYKHLSSTPHHDPPLPQDQVNPHELSRRLEEVLVDAVNDVGVDLNKAVRVALAGVPTSLAPFIPHSIHPVPQP